MTSYFNACDVTVAQIKPQKNSMVFMMCTCALCESFRHPWCRSGVGN